MSEQVDLANFETRLGRATNIQASAPGAFLLIFSLLDTVAAIRGDGLLLPLTAIVMDGLGLSAYLPMALACFQALLLFLAYRTLANAGLYGSLIPESRRAGTMRAPDALGTRIPVPQVIGMVSIAALLFFLGYLPPLSLSPEAILLLAVAAAGAGYTMMLLIERTVESARRLDDRSAARGAAVAIAVVLLASMLFANRRHVMIGLADWFPVGETAILIGVSIVAYLVMRPSDPEIFTLSVSVPRTAPRVTSADPFKQRSRLPRYLTFGVSQGQMAVLTRKQDAKVWQVADTTDTQMKLPLHDRTVMIWNLSRLAEELTSVVEVTDNHECLKLTIELGNLLMPSKIDTNTPISHAAVWATTECLFQNNDINGLTRRAALAALEDALTDEVPRIHATLSLLGRAPTTASLLANHSFGATTPSAERAEQLQSAVKTAKQYQKELSERETELRRISSGLRDRSGEIQDIWFEKMANDIVNAGRKVDGSISESVTHTIELLHVLGIRTNSTKIALTGDGANCAAKLDDTRHAIEALVKDFEARYNEAAVEAEKARMDLVKNVTDGYSLARREKAIVILSTLTGTPMKKIDLDQATALPPGQDGTDDDENDDGGLN